MYRYWWTVALLFVLGTLAGCGSSRVPPPKDWGGPPVGTKLDGGKLDPSLAELLKRPRKELADLYAETLATVVYQAKNLEGKDETGGPLGMLRPAPAIPVFRDAKFSDAAGFSLPPYLKAGQRDPAVALHLARHGDAEAARKLVDPGDRDTLARIDALALKPNIPLEWTRLAALRMHSAAQRLALNDAEGAVDVVTLHRQLRDALGEKAAATPLGAALLGRGRKVLALAGGAWRERKRTDLADQVDKVLQSWGNVPIPASGLPTGQRWSDAVRAIDGKEEGRIARGDLLRSLDLLALPLPESGAQAVLAFRDGDRLGEVLVVYRTGGGKAYRDPSHLALGLEDSAPAQQEEVRPGLPRRSYTLGTTVCEVALMPRSGQVSGVVRVNAGKSLAVASLPRDLGAVNLSRSFEQNRVQLAPAQRGDTAQSTQAAVLDRVQNPLRPASLSRVAVRRESGRTGTAGVTLSYDASSSTPPIAELAAPAWGAWGPCRFEPVEDEQGGHLGLVWEDARTRVVLRLPYPGAETVTLDILDARPDQVRDAGALDLDREERKARLAAGKPLVRLSRSVGPLLLQLGMSREQVLQSLPSGRGVYTRDMSGGVLTTLTVEPAKGATITPRQVLVRFAPDGKAGEVRVRFQDVAGQGRPRGTKDLLDGLTKRHGAGLEGTSPWAPVWPDRKPVLYAWRDDLTVLTCQTDGAIAEVAVRDCPVEQPEGVSLPPLTYLPPGPESCLLGEARGELLRKWNVKQPLTTSDGALVLAGPKGSPYEVLLVYFADDKVQRVVAKHRQEKPLSPQPQHLASALSDAWGQELRTIGWPRREDVNSYGHLQGLGFHDERTVVKLFWQDDSRGKPSLFTEWTGVPR